FLFYYIDKTAAIQGKWRKSEDSLHLLSLLGGWPTAYIAQKMFLHKYKKTSFMVIYTITVIINSLLVLMYSIPELSSLFS
ncbi:MAG: DUF1294 domain-containing protein, partial [Nitrosomonadales bacterium]|nr:DUF1294 domain-containing protein [Nitrosomonadales bacterium]